MALDHMPEIIQIIRDALTDGLIRGEKRRVFEKKIKVLKGHELEDYLQKLWDDFPSSGWQNRKP